MLSVQNVSFNIGGKFILNEVSMFVGKKQHTGLVGRNGSGKSSLFKIIQGQIDYDGGTIKIESGCKVLSIKQEMPSGNLSPREFLLDQDVARKTLLEKLENCHENPEDISEIYDQLIQINAFDAESRAAVILKGMGFDEEAQNAPIESFSGGFRMRIALGAVLFQEPDLLLLDEPTNHLDLETTDWLRDFLRSYPKSFILISHDRDFLNDTVDYVFHLKGGKITRYTGNFDTFLDTYSINRKNAEEYNAKMAEKREHMLAFVKRFQYKATKARQAQSRIKMIEKLKFLPLEENDPSYKFNFPEPQDTSPNILSFEKVFLGYGEKIVLKNISGSIMSHDRIAIVGANGNGKTTLAKFLAGELKQKKGTRQADNKLKIGFYRQDLFEKLMLTETAYDHVKRLMPNAIDRQIREHLGRFGLSGDKAFQKISELSGGEKARLVFASLTIEAPKLLILDEPTNHLDMEMRESLICTLSAYKGAVVLITHDRHFLNRTANTIFIVNKGTVEQFNGDVSQYENSIKAARKM